MLFTAPAQGQGKISYLREKGNPAVWLEVSVLLVVATVLLEGVFHDLETVLGTSHALFHLIKPTPYEIE